MAESEESREHGRGVVFGLLISFLLAGMAASVYLLVNHINHAIGGPLGGFCDMSTKVNCTAALESSYSSILGFPTAVFALAFYAGLLSVAIRSGVSRDRTAAALLMLCFVFAVLFSGFLLFVMLAKLEAVCPGCLALDVVAVAGLVVSSIWAGGFVKGFKHLFSAPTKTATSPAVFYFVVVAALVFLGANFVYQSYVDQAEQADREYTQDEAFDLVVNYPTRYPLSTGRSPSIGPDDAAVVIAEFSDFECPYCGQFRHTLERLQETYPDDIRVHFMHYPLSNACNVHVDSEFHVDACTAARATVCAQVQDQFWPMYDQLFDNQTHLDRASILSLAAELDLDQNTFRACLDDNVSLERVQEDIAIAWRATQQAGLDGIGTPFCFVNGFLVRGNQPLGALRTLVESELRRVREEGSGE